MHGKNGIIIKYMHGPKWHYYYGHDVQRYYNGHTLFQVNFFPTYCHYLDNCQAPPAEPTLHLKKTILSLRDLTLKSKLHIQGPTPTFPTARKNALHD